MAGPPKVPKTQFDEVRGASAIGVELNGRTIRAKERTLTGRRDQAWWVTQGGQRDLSCAGTRQCPLPLYLWIGYSIPLDTPEVFDIRTTPGSVQLTRGANWYGSLPCYPEDSVITTALPSGATFEIDNRLPLNDWDTRYLESRGITRGEHKDFIYEYGCPYGAQMLGLDLDDQVYLADVLRAEGLTEAARYDRAYTTYYPERGRLMAYNAYLNRALNRMRWKNTNLFRREPDFTPARLFGRSESADRILGPIIDGMVSKLTEYHRNPVAFAMDMYSIYACAASAGVKCGLFIDAMAIYGVGLMGVDPNDYHKTMRFVGYARMLADIDPGKAGRTFGLLFSKEGYKQAAEHLKGEITQSLDKVEVQWDKGTIQGTLRAADEEGSSVYGLIGRAKTARAFAEQASADIQSLFNDNITIINQMRFQAMLRLPPRVVRRSLEPSTHGGEAWRQFRWSTAGGCPHDPLTLGLLEQAAMVSRQAARQEVRQLQGIHLERLLAMAQAAARVGGVAPVPQAFSHKSVVRTALDAVAGLTLPSFAVAGIDPETRAGLQRCIDEAQAGMLDELAALGFGVLKEYIRPPTLEALLGLPAPKLVLPPRRQRQPRQPQQPGAHPPVSPGTMVLGALGLGVLLYGAVRVSDGTL